MMRKTSTTIAALVLTTLALAACSSINGRKVIETDHGTKTVDVGGLPIVVQRPTRAVFVLTETVYSVTLTTFDANNEENVENLPDQMEQTISDKPLFLGPAELFTIDPERPAYGTLDYTMAFEGYYPTSINSTIDDKTFGELRALIENLAEKIIPRLAAPTVEKQAGGLIKRAVKDRRTSLIIFDLESGTLEVRSF